MRHDQSWKRQAHQAASEALKDIGTGANQEEMESRARTALEPLTREYEYAEKIEQAVNGVYVDGANYDELREGQELVREALSALPNSAGNRQIAEAKRAQP